MTKFRIRGRNARLRSATIAPSNALGDPPAASDFVFYERPTSDRLSLSATPRLESWDAADSPSQVALRSYLDGVAQLVEPKLSTVNDPAALALRIGLPSHLPLTRGGRDLDNYLYPVVRRLGADRFNCVWGEKLHGRSSLAVAAADRSQPPQASHGWSFGVAVGRSSPQSKQWKEELRSQFPQVDAGGGPVEVHLGFRLGAGRNWAALWKPAIDSLGGILRVDNPRQPFDPRDDRIVVLGLHCTVDADMGWDVAVAVWWRKRS